MILRHFAEKCRYGKSMFIVEKPESVDRFTARMTLCGDVEISFALE